MKQSEKDKKDVPSPTTSRSVYPSTDGEFSPRGHMSPPESPERESPSGDRRKKAKGFKKTFSPLMRHRTEGSVSDQKPSGSWSPKLLKLSRRAKPKDKVKPPTTPSGLKIAVSPRSERPVSPRSRSKSPRVGLTKAIRKKRSNSVSESPKPIRLDDAKMKAASMHARRVLSLNDLGPDAKKAAKLKEDAEAKKRSKNKTEAATSNPSSDHKAGSRHYSRSSSMERPR